MEFHDLKIANAQYKELLSSIHEGYPLDDEEAEFMNELEEVYGLELTRPEINQEVYDEEDYDENN